MQWPTVFRPDFRLVPSNVAVKYSSLKISEGICGFIGNILSPYSASESVSQANSLINTLLTAIASVWVITYLCRAFL